MENAVVQKQEYYKQSFKDYLKQLSKKKRSLEYVHEEEVFLLDTGTRIALNALPEIMQMIEAYSFEKVRTVLKCMDYEMGYSFFNSEEINEQVLNHAKIMTTAGIAGFYYDLRKKILYAETHGWLLRNEQIKCAHKTIEAITTVQWSGENWFVQENLLPCEQCSFIDCLVTREAITTELCEFIIEHVGYGDREAYLDIIKTRFLLGTW